MRCSAGRGDAGVPETPAPGTLTRSPAGAPLALEAGIRWVCPNPRFSGADGTRKGSGDAPRKPSGKGAVPARRGTAEALGADAEKGSELAGR
jgi:hypothetical protein